MGSFMPFDRELKSPNQASYLILIFTYPSSLAAQCIFIGTYNPLGVFRALVTRLPLSSLRNQVVQYSIYN